MTSATPSSRPRLTVEDRGTALGRPWKDQTGGRAQFLVVDVTGGTENTVVQGGQGFDVLHVEGVDPALPKVCVQVAALVLVDGVQDGGASQPTCVGRN